MWLAIQIDEPNIKTLRLNKWTPQSWLNEFRYAGIYYKMPFKMGHLYSFLVEMLLHQKNTWCGRCVKNHQVFIEKPMLQPLVPCRMRHFPRQTDGWISGFLWEKNPLVLPTRKLEDFKAFLRWPSGKLTWKFATETAFWWCIPYWKWWLSIAMLISWSVEVCCNFGSPPKL